MSLVDTGNTFTSNKMFGAAIYLPKYQCKEKIEILIISLFL